LNRPKFTKDFVVLLENNKKLKKTIKIDRFGAKNFVFTTLCQNTSTFGNLAKSSNPNPKTP
jgi:hypothetical protein